jgi:uncharacterized alkaline shock family protein YloU
VADRFAVFAAPAQPARDGDPGRRGALVIRGKAAERIVAKAAVDTAGVVRRAAALARVTRRDVPKVVMTIGADRARVAVDVAVPWAYPLATVTAAVRDNVARALTELTGLHVDGVDVTVSSVVAPAAVSPARTVL